MRIGSTEVKNWAAMVIDRSKMPSRTLARALRIAIRPGHWESSHASGRCSSPGGEAGSRARARASASSDPLAANRSVVLGHVPAQSHRSVWRLTWRLRRWRSRARAPQVPSRSGLPEINGQGPACRGVGLDQQRPGEQGERYGEQGAERPDDPGPEDQREEGQRRAERPTASPTTRGWITDWITKLITL